MGQHTTMTPMEIGLLFIQMELNNSMNIKEMIYMITTGMILMEINTTLELVVTNGFIP